MVSTRPGADYVVNGKKNEVLVWSYTMCCLNSPKQYATMMLLALLLKVEFQNS
jgi:hypothetical protein